MMTLMTLISYCTTKGTILKDKSEGFKWILVLKVKTAWYSCFFLMYLSSRSKRSCSSGLHYADFLPLQRLSRPALDSVAHGKLNNSPRLHQDYVLSFGTNGTVASYVRPHVDRFQILHSR